ncbi:hypothetical protein [Halomonas huangheensis]|uniref:Uncharacterized protein n=1 Tax=Halomonas huangheensis TaxID=1178482 RepID=W1N2Y4_9GAMM|nr:hypothetical protein [Halomonas huangheensis]ALM51477.1 hypothetical protein AR456_03575 [Halomonas huangheensis]ERL49932.1 hypothetical protein BJB45_02065 [Halomonas huangheensis]
MKVYRPQWRCTLNVSESAPSTARWQERLAWYLRSLADRLDGNTRTLALALNVQPDLSRDEIDTCLAKGFTLSQGLMTTLAQQAACEDVMREAKSELFDSES